MKHFMFVKILVLVGIVTVMGKIYQHNKIVQASYTKQRLEVAFRKSVKEYDALTIKKAELTNYVVVKNLACSAKQMEPLCLCRVITITSLL